jgi:hypothetical protein
MENVAGNSIVGCGERRGDPSGREETDMANNIRLVQIINQTTFEGFFANLETRADDVPVSASGPTNTPGQSGEGCHIPDCGAGKWWESHRMTITLDQNILSLWKEGNKVYYRLGQTVYPGEGRGEFLWADNGIPVVLNISPDATATMLNP